MRLAVIPARGGSKRIPRKNIKRFAGRPMIAWSIEAAKRSGCFDRVVVSTDDDEIAAVARAEGAETPFVRPAELAGDHAGTIPVVAHAVQWFAAQGMSPAEVCCIYATAPFLRPESIVAGLEILERDRRDYAFAVTTYAAPIQRAYRMAADGRLSMFHPENFDVRSQDLEEAWHDAGQFYWARAETWSRGLPISRAEAGAVRLPRHLVQDIDTPEDWTRAELMFEVLAKQRAA